MDGVEKEVVVLARIELVADMGEKLACIFKTAWKTVY